MEQWRIVFCITAAMLLVTGVAYVLFGRSEVQPWNEPADGHLDNGLAEGLDEEDKSIVTVTSKCSELKSVC